MKNSNFRSEVRYSRGYAVDENNTAIKAVTDKSVVSVSKISVNEIYVHLHETDTVSAEATYKVIKAAAKLATTPLEERNDNSKKMSVFESSSYEEFLNTLSKNPFWRIGCAKYDQNGLEVYEGEKRIIINTLKQGCATFNLHDEVWSTKDFPLIQAVIALTETPLEKRGDVIKEVERFILNYKGEKNRLKEYIKEIGEEKTRRRYDLKEILKNKLVVFSITTPRRKEIVAINKKNAVLIEKEENKTSVFKANMNKKIWNMAKEITNLSSLKQQREQQLQR